MRTKKLRKPNLGRNLMKCGSMTLELPIPTVQPLNHQFKDNNSRGFYSIPSLWGLKKFWIIWVMIINFQVLQEHYPNPDKSVPRGTENLWGCPQKFRRISHKFRRGIIMIWVSFWWFEKLLQKVEFQFKSVNNWIRCCTFFSSLE